MPGLTAILRDLGYPVILADPERIARWLARDGASDAEREALPFLGQFAGEPGTVVRDDTEATRAALAGFTCPAPDLGLFTIIIGHGIETGFCPKSGLWDFVSRR